MRLPKILLLTVAVLVATTATAAAQSTVSTPSARTLYENGPSGRFLMDGTWLRKLDNRQSGPQRETGTAGWTRVTVPNAWNAGDDSDASFAGGVGWYRKDFRFPSSNRALSWVVRFESVNYRMRAWLNGRPIGTNRGAYLPFELRLPRGLIRRGRVNRLVVRVDSRRFPTDFPPAGLSTTGVPTGGWWNYGGILREVYLRRIADIDFNTVVVRPNLPCATCAASVTYRVTLRNYGQRARRINVRARFGSRRINLGRRSIGPRRFTTFTRTVGIGRPRLWSPDSPALYDAPLTVSSGGRTLQRYSLRTGVRSIKVVGGRLVLNGRPLNFRGVFVHEDDKRRGFAIDNRVRERQLGWTRQLGATMLRGHYPLHPYYQERADELGIMQWSEVPVYSVRAPYLKQALVRQLAARELESNIEANGNHPSVITWSIGNELSSRPGPVQGDYIQRAATAAKRLDPSRPVSYAVAGYPSVGCQARYGPLDIIGVNDYFGWYPGPGGQIADRTLLSEYLDQVRACYPRKAIVVSEFGAEANRPGPVEEKGTLAFQQDFVNFHLGTFATKPWLSGAIYFALQEFRVRPNWDGNNPRPNPPIHQKGLVTFDGVPKPAFADVQRLFRATTQIGPAPAR
ncbi:MAG TPA: glycoside hydrolase family 2 TIM barrel-domain containing protein [Solirubrobacteraceae bacterium]|nr:glycoside hydrolase family 2 TIM barrel-domain containing protein [Solirubrobacteraceae bacterium]